MKSLPFSFGQIVTYGLMLLFANSTLGQDILWEKSLGGRHDDFLMDAQPTPDNGFILAGSSLSNNSGNKVDPNNGDLDYWIWKMNEDGDLEWQKNFGGTGTDFLQNIKLTRDGGFILGGISNSNKGFDKTDDSKGQDDFWIIKLNAGGGQQWQKTIGGLGQEKLQSIIQTKDGGYIIGGSSSSNKSEDKDTDSFGNMDYWLVKLNSDGKTEWQKTFGGIYYDELRSIEQTSDQGFIVGGYSNSPMSGNKSENNIGEGDFWILKLDKKGEIEWQKTFGGNKDDQLSIVHQYYDGNYIIGGSSNSDNSFEKKVGNDNGTDFWISKLDSDGNSIWQNNYNIGKEDMLTSLIENDDHSLLLGGMAVSESKSGHKDDKGINDFVGLKINEKGEEIWRRSVGSDGADILKKIIETRDGGYLLAGMSNPNKKGNPAYSATKSQKTGGVTLGNGKNVKALDDATNFANEQMQEINNAVNGFVKEQVDQLNNKTKELTDKLNKDSRVKFGASTSAGNLLNNNNPFGGGGNDLLSGLTGANDNKSPNSNASGDKEKNYGMNDFWVVKLKDKMKSGKIKAALEAYPNPVTSFTNAVVGFPFEKGYLTISDISGHILQGFEISNRTTPVDMSGFGEGIYIITVKADKKTESVKVIKGTSK